MTDLRTYQDDAISSVLDYWANGGGNPLVDMATGTGKSVVLATLTKRLIEQFPAMRIILLVHVRELVEQNAKALLRTWPQAPIGINSAGLGRRDKRSQILYASIQSVAREDAFSLGERHLILVDECFAAGTLVLTPYGAKPIELVRPGDAVFNASGTGFVEATRSSFSTDIWNVELEDGCNIKCTGNHPFFTENGWVQARRLEEGWRLFGQKDVRALWSGFSSLDKCEQWRGRLIHEAGSVGEAAFLLNLLLEEIGERHARHSGAREDGGDTAQDWPSAESAGRQWARPDCRPEFALEGTWSGLDAGTCNSDKDATGERLSDKLQDRYRAYRTQDRNRSGRQHAFWQADRRGFQEVRSVDGPRVARVARDECAGDTVVFNLQVSGHPSFFANGVLTHNCHLIPKSSNGQYRGFIDKMRAAVPDLRIAGFTATPYRFDSGRLDDGDDCLFDDVVYSYDIGRGVDDGYLSPLVSRATGAVIDVSNVKRAGGEFVAGALEAACLQDSVTQSACDEIVAKGTDRRAWLAFCAGVAHAEAARDALRARGVRAEMVTGETPKAERDRLIRDFREGRIKCLTNANVLTTGFDAPIVDMIAMLRPTLSTSLYVQMLGRGTRLADGKDNCLVLDFAENVRRHGPVDAIQIRPKGGSAGDGARTEVDAIKAKACPNCETLVGIRVYECPCCGHEWERPTEPKHKPRADTEAAVMAREIVDRWLPVTAVDGFEHVKPDTPPSLRVEYLTGHTIYKEWIFIEHPGFAGATAQKWWRAIVGTPAPAKSAEAAARLPLEAKIIAITIVRDGKYWRVSSRRVRRSDGRIIEIDDKLNARPAALQIVKEATE